MAQNKHVTLYQWILEEFVVAVRAKSMEILVQPLASLVRSGDQVLDLCCGTGPMSFWFEEQGAQVVAMDFAPYMIDLARDEPARRHSTVEFVEGNVLLQDLGEGRYDLVACLGNSMSDFPLPDFGQLGKQVARALKPGGRFVVDYHDGSYRYIQGRALRAGIQQEAPERVTYRFKEYSPELGAIVKLYRNEARGEEYEYIGYVYTVPVVQLALSGGLDLEAHTRLAENHFLDVFTKKTPMAT